MAGKLPAALTAAAGGALVSTSILVGSTAAGAEALKYSIAQIAAIVLDAPSIVGGSHTAMTSLGVRSTGSGAFDLTLANTENLSAGRTLTLTVNDANRTINLGGNLTLGAAFTTTPANALTLTTTGATNVTLPTTGTLVASSGALTNGRVPFADAGGALTDSANLSFAVDTLTVAGTTVFDEGIEINNGGSGDRDAYVDFHAADAPPDFSARIIRNLGANSQLDIIQTGTGDVRFITGGGQQFLVSNTATAVNYLAVNGGVMGSNPVLSAQGSDTDISLSIVPKGVGHVRVENNLRVFSDSGAQVQIRDPNAVGADAAYYAIYMDDVLEAYFGYGGASTTLTLTNNGARPVTITNTSAEVTIQGDGIIDAFGDGGFNGDIGIVPESSTARTLEIEDRGKDVRCSNGAETTITIPANADVPFRIGTQIVITKAGAGNVVIVGDAGVTVNFPGGADTIEEQYGKVALEKVATNTWDAEGRLA